MLTENGCATVGLAVGAGSGDGVGGMDVGMETAVWQAFNINKMSKKSG